MSPGIRGGFLWDSLYGIGYTKEKNLNRMGLLKNPKNEKDFQKWKIKKKERTNPMILKIPKANTKNLKTS